MSPYTDQSQIPLSKVEKLKIRQLDDIKKIELCKKNNINLIIIPYNIKNIKTFILNKCKELGFNFSKTIIKNTSNSYKQKQNKQKQKNKQNKFLNSKNKTKNLTLQEKINELLELIKKQKKIKKIDKFTNNTNIYYFRRDILKYNKCNKPIYNKLLSNHILKNK